MSGGQSKTGAGCRREDTVESIWQRRRSWVARRCQEDAIGWGFVPIGRVLGYCSPGGGRTVQGVGAGELFS